MLAIGLALEINAQTADHAIRRQVLDSGIVDQEFVFGQWSESGQTETRLTLLGEVLTSDGKRFKVMNSTWLWGLSCRATSRILIYSERNEYLGNYYVQMIDDLPGRIEDGSLIFEPQAKDHCDAPLVARVDLTRGFPKRFFVNCNGEYVFE